MKILLCQSVKSDIVGEYTHLISNLAQVAGKKFHRILNWLFISLRRFVRNILLLIPLALQPAVGFGLSNNILPFFPPCHQLSPSSLNPSSLFLCSTSVTIRFYCVGLLAPRQTPNLEDQGIPFCLGHGRPYQ
jgi:hypothetical protein